MQHSRFVVVNENKSYFQRTRIVLFTKILLDRPIKLSGAERVCTRPQILHTTYFQFNVTFCLLYGRLD